MHIIRNEKVAPIKQNTFCDSKITVHKDYRFTALLDYRIVFVLMHFSWDTCDRALPTESVVLGCVRLFI